MPLAEPGGVVERDEQFVRGGGEFGGAAVNRHALNGEAYGIQRDLGNVVPRGRYTFVYLAANLVLREVKPEMRADILQIVILAARVRLVGTAGPGPDRKTSKHKPKLSIAHIPASVLPPIHSVIQYSLPGEEGSPSVRWEKAR